MNVFLDICRKIFLMKKLFFVLFCLPLTLLAQEGKTYITHTVAPKETLYSLGRQFNIHPKEIASFNNLDFNQGLTIGQVIKIPAKGTPAPHVPAPVAKINETPDEHVETGNPIYHVVQKKETLYAISQQYGKVPIADLKKWNHLSSDGVNEGVNLIVGYQKNKPGGKESKKEVKLDKQEPDEQVIEHKAEPQKKIEEPKNIQVATTVPANTKNELAKEDASTSAGFFKSAYHSSDKRSEETGIAGVFKSTSGWDDGKYYCLHNSAPANSIVKITNTSNNKVVYAKVLDVIPNLKQNEKIIIQLSNAAANALGAGEENFECIVNY